MKIAELKGLPNWQATAVDNQTGHAIAIVRAGNDGYHVIRGEVRRGAFNLLRSVGGLDADYARLASAKFTLLPRSGSASRTAHGEYLF